MMVSTAWGEIKKTRSSHTRAQRSVRVNMRDQALRIHRDYCLFRRRAEDVAATGCAFEGRGRAEELFVGWRFVLG